MILKLHKLQIDSLSRELTNAITTTKVKFLVCEQTILDVVFVSPIQKERIPTAWLHLAIAKKKYFEVTFVQYRKMNQEWVFL